MIDSQSTCPRGRRRASWAPHAHEAGSGATGECAGGDPAKACAVIRGCVGWGSVIWTVGKNPPMRVLAITHQGDAGPGVFAEEMAERGVEHHEWMLREVRAGPPLEITEYAAVMSFGGAMHADQEDRHPWLR